MMSFLTRRSRLMLFMAALVVWATAAQATDPTRTLAQLHHTALRVEDGAPPSVVAMAQTEDGWLWLSTRMGLYRYDGFTFEKLPLLPPSSNESESTWNLYAAPGGDLWVAFANGGVARVRHDEVTLYGKAQGLPDHVAVDEFATDADGVLWTHSEVGLYRFDGKRWKEATASWGISHLVKQFLEDPRGNLWAMADQELYVLHKGAKRFTSTGIAGGRPSHLLMHPDGSLWLRTAAGIRRLPGAWGAPFPHAAPRYANSSSTQFDRDGNFWTLACEDNLCRLPAKYFAATSTGMVDESAMQKSGDELGMTSQATIVTMEDRDGDVWVSTKAGLDRFRDSWLASVRFPQLEVYFALVEDGAGQMWTGTSASAAYPDYLWKLNPEPHQVPGFEGATTSAYRDSDGSVWFGGTGKLWHMTQGQLRDIPLPDGASAHDSIVQAIARDGSGRLWISLRLRGVFTQDGDGWLPAATIAPFRAVTPAVIHVDSAGRPWFGYLDGTVTMLDGNTLHHFGAGEGLEQGPVSAIATVGDHIVVGSEHGLSFFDGERFRRIAAQPSDRLNSITGIVSYKDGSVWAYGVAGVIRFSAAAWKASLARPDVAADVQLLTMEDGAPGPAQLVRPLPTVIAGSDGRLWFAGSQGLAWLDPTRPPALPSPPTVVIKSIRAGGHVFRPGQTVDMHDNRDLDVSYTALAPGRPVEISFRYRLEGVDDTVQEAGSRREALYADVPPGNHTFWVEASYDGQRWSRATSFSLTVKPHLVERLSFKVFCVLCVALLVWFVHRWRMRLATQRLRLRLDERHGERERIARELHDTLLQGMQGLILKFQAFADGLSGEDKARAGLERTIDRAEELLVEGRDRVKGLRSHWPEEASMKNRIERLADDVGIPVHISVKYEYRRRAANPVVCDEVYSIIREAVINAMQHSRAQSIWISIGHSRTELKISIRDDGTGFTPSLENHRSGHFGLVGMRERASRMGAKFTVQSAPQRGTEVKLTIPARVAYNVGPGFLASLFAKKAGAERRKSDPGSP